MIEISQFRQNEVNRVECIIQSAISRAVEEAKEELTLRAVKDGMIARNIALTKDAIVLGLSIVILLMVVCGIGLRIEYRFDQLEARLFGDRGTHAKKEGERS